MVQLGSPFMTLCDCGLYIYIYKGFKLYLVFLTEYYGLLSLWLLVLIVNDFDTSKKFCYLLFVFECCCPLENLSIILDQYQ